MNTFNATSNTNWGTGFYVHEVNIPAIFICYDHYDCEKHMPVNKSFNVSINAICTRSSGKTGHYIIYFDSYDKVPLNYTNNRGKSQYRCDSITSFKLLDGKSLRSYFKTIKGF